MKYLGREFSFNEYHGTELHHQIKRACVVFHKFKDELCHKKFHRNRDCAYLMQSLGLWHCPESCGSWTMPQVDEKTLRFAQWAMLRRVLGRHWNSNLPKERKLEDCFYFL